MSIFAVLLTMAHIVMSPMSDLVILVLAVGPPRKVLYSVVLWIAVKVAGLRIRGTRACERFKDQRMNCGRGRHTVTCI